MIVLVAGGKDFADAGQMKRVLDDVCGWSADGHITIINAGTPGAAQLSTAWAKERGEKVREFPTMQVAGNFRDVEMRNQEMIDVGRPDQAVIFTGDGDTLDMLARLWEVGINVWVVGRNI